jgi:hypothetical protein
MMHFNCKTVSGNPRVGPLVFDWDEEAGTVAGPGAADVMAWIAQGSIPAHPLPWAYQFPPNALKSREAIAAIIGLRHDLPVELVGSYPQRKGDRIFAETIDAADNVVGRTEVDY